MIVYVETNFVLELGYLRSTSDNCQSLLDLAREGRLKLVIPAFSLVEARMAWQGVVRRRNRLQSDVRQELAELARSRPLVGIGEQSQAFIAALIDTAQDDRFRIESSIAALVEHAIVLSTHQHHIAVAFLLEQRIGLSAQDALVYASVIDHAAGAGEEAKLFVTQNTRDFAIPTVQDELTAYGCRLITKFDDAERIVRHELAG